MIDIILPTYNSKKYICELLDSILNQSYQNFRIIISDDNSNDSTKKILKTYKNKFPDKIILNINQKNLGLVENINKLISFASSDYIACADHDDIWHEDRLETQLNFLKNNSCIACFSDRKVFNKNGIILDSEFKNKEFTKKVANTKIIINRNSVHSFNTLMFENKTEITKAVFPINSKINIHDYWIALFLSIYGGNIGYIHRPLVNYRIHENNLSSNYFWHNNLGYKNYKDLYVKTINRLKTRMRSEKIINKKLKLIGCNSFKIKVFTLKRIIYIITPFFLIYFKNKYLNN